MTAPVLDCRFAMGLGTGTATSGGEGAGSAGAGAGSETGCGTGTVSVGGDLATPPSEKRESWSALLWLEAAMDDGRGRGGHSRFSFCSIFSASPDALFCDVTLEVRGGTFGTIDWRFVCCSNRPMRLATLCLGRSSGNGLRCTRGVTRSVCGDTRWIMCGRTSFERNESECGYLVVLG